MYLHLGQGTVVPYGDVIGIFDLDRVSASRHTRDFLSQGEREGTLRPIGGRIPVSLVVTAEGSWLSPISAQTLTRRLMENQVP